MEKTILTGNVLLRHGFYFSSQWTYSLVLPLARNQFSLDWAASAGLYLILNTVPDVDENTLLDLEHIDTLEQLKDLYKNLTNKELAPLPESDEGLQQQIDSRARLFKLEGRKVENLGNQPYVRDQI